MATKDLTLKDLLDEVRISNGKMGDLVNAIVKGSNAEEPQTDWKALKQEYISNPIAFKATHPVGYTIPLKWHDSYNNQTYNVDMDIVHYGKAETESGESEGFYLQTHGLLPILITFDESEYFACFEDLKAGTYSVFANYVFYIFNVPHDYKNAKISFCDDDRFVSPSLHNTCNKVCINSDYYDVEIYNICNDEIRNSIDIGTLLYITREKVTDGRFFYSTSAHDGVVENFDSRYFYPGVNNFVVINGSKAFILSAIYEAISTVSNIRITKIKFFKNNELAFPTENDLDDLSSFTVRFCGTGANNEGSSVEFTSDAYPLMLASAPPALYGSTETCFFVADKDWDEINIDAINDLSFVENGSNRYSQSAIRQWLNSSDVAGAWWEPQNKWDMPSSDVELYDGMVRGLPNDFVNAVKPIKVNTINGDGVDTTFDKFFLPSIEEHYYVPVEGTEGKEGTAFDYWKIASGRDTPVPFDTECKSMIQYNITARVGAPHNWWLRSPFDSILNGLTSYKILYYISNVDGKIRKDSHLYSNFMNLVSFVCFIGK